eukprot:TRINITY_DN972_c0_g1_i1.p1 TRINITY_DN972_c0_g1~~TRINITY_DN972_c0_g1_i1.p1  ORF type:complete len:397 (+),score=85.46 TRINITY_DN972_c0_g1_i1:174-1364(+)
MDPTVNMDALKSEIRSAIINSKVNACPMIVRLAWHSAGTFDKADNSGGSNGAGMRFAPESTDDANAGLDIVRTMLLPIKQRHPEISYSDLWAVAGACAIEFLGGPANIHVGCGRTDRPNGSGCPANGRLPDAAQGAQHLRDVFYRMGFDDRGIVALSGAHTLGSCHISRSGFDGPWTRNPLKFDNAYFKHLLHGEWKPRVWEGPLQYTDQTEELMMLPTDICLLSDPSFRPWVEKYAKDEAAFFEDFTDAFSKLMLNGVTEEREVRTELDKVSSLFRECCMHGYEEKLRNLATQADVHGADRSSGRTAVHKAAFWGHDHILRFLLNELKIDPNMQDSLGDTALHDAAQFGHQKCIDALLAAPLIKVGIKNAAGKTAADVAAAFNQQEAAGVIRSRL